MFAVTLAIHLTYLSRPTFLDEMDNMIGGNVVAQGGAVYTDFFSQHMPMAYWLSGVGYAVGFTSFTTQRFFVYAIFALLLALLYARNVRVFGRIPMLVVVVLVPMMHDANPELSYTVLSDNYQALFGLYLLFEVITMGLRRDSSLRRWAMIATAAALSFSVAFVSVYYSAAVIVCAALLSVLNDRHRLTGARAWFRFVGLRALVTVVPFLLLVVSIALTGALHDAYRQAYVLNRTYYPQYLADGFGANPLEPFFGGLTAIATQTFTARGLTETFSRELVYQFAFLVVFLLTCVFVCFVRPVLGVCIFWMGSLTATRGWSGFHSQPLWAFFVGTAGLMVWLVIAWASQRSTAEARPKGARVMVASLVVAAIASVGSYPFARTTYENRDQLLTRVVFPNPDRTALIEALVPPGEAYGELNINNVYDFVLTRRLPAGGISGVTPWFGDMFDEEMTNRVKSDPPVLFFSDEENLVWGHVVADHIPLLQAYLKENYTPVSVNAPAVSQGIFIRNDDVQRVLPLLQQRFPGTNLPSQTSPR
ncbi:hypothetical protein GCM10023065_08300 [Microbacterium laevaniformans]|nr:hypothetical protein GCM10017578_07520 [Microbacterium laevaniformans]